MSGYHPHVIPLRTNLIIFGILMGLLVLTIGGAFLPVNSRLLHLGLAMTIAVVKAVIILLYFMHVRYSNRVIWVCSSAAVLWLVIMFLLVFADYTTRGALGVPGK